MCCAAKGFCFMRLHTAGVVITWIDGVISLLQSIVLTMVLDNINLVKDEDNFFGYGRELKRQIADSAALGATMIVSLLLAMSLLSLLVSVLALHGIKKDMHLMLLPWMIHSVIAFIAKLIFLGGSSIGLSVSTENPLPFIFALIIFVLHWWIWNAMYSLFITIRSANENENGSDREKLTVRPNAQAYEMLN